MTLINLVFKRVILHKSRDSGFTRQVGRKYTESPDILIKVSVDKFS